MQPESYEVVLRLLLAAALGSVVGIERERHGEEKERVAGIRTFTLTSLLGATSSLLHIFTGEALPLAASILGFTLLVVMLIWIRREQGFYGFTTPIAFTLTYFVGLLAGFGKLIESSTLGILTTVFLLGKERLHVLARGLTASELLGALEFLAIALILLPLVEYVGDLPVIGRGQILDVYWILIIVVIISSISFVSYVALRLLRPGRSLPLVGILGGLVNSEATVISLGELSRASGNVRVYVSPIMLANASMLIRNIVIAAISDPKLTVFRLLVLPLGSMLMVDVVLAALLHSWGAVSEGIGEIRLESPFALKSALSFGGLFAVFNALVYLLNRLSGGLSYLVSLGGLVSSGAVTASMASLVYSGHMDAHYAAGAILLASTISTLNKILLLRFANKRLVGLVALGILPVAAVGLFWFVLKFL